MYKNIILIIPLIICFLIFPVFSTSLSAEPEEIMAPHYVEDDDEFEDPFSDETSEQAQTVTSIADPFQSVNRAMFHINDKFYIYVFNPVSRGYGHVVPLKLRESLTNFFSNLSSPIRFSNCLLQGKFKGAGIELKRFTINSTLGVLGFFDQAEKDWNLKEQDEDVGQTLAVYGIGDGFYLVLPFFGPSSVRDGIGRIGNAYLHPVTYQTDFITMVQVKVVEVTNENSLDVGQYERLKKGTFDPYIALRDGYYQYRQNKIKE